MTGVEHALADTLAYLDSEAALASLAVDVYWPKWTSPWWHALALHELGETARIPRAVIDAIVAGLARLAPIFPLTPAEVPPGADPAFDLGCHCALGTMTCVLAGAGVDVDAALPFARPWFARYQMADGGFNCDETAYGVVGECPSSIVATIAVLEALLALPAWTDRDRAVADGAARNLIARELDRGSPTVHNAEERDAARAWAAITFPRFYFYDVLRGVAALARWAERTGQPIPRAAIARVVDGLAARFPDGVVRVERRAYADKTTRVPRTAARIAAALPPLVDAIGTIGREVPALTRAWAETRARLADVARG